MACWSRPSASAWLTTWLAAAARLGGPRGRPRAAGQARMAGLLMRLRREAPPPLLAQRVLAAVDSARQAARPRWLRQRQQPVSVALVSGLAALAGLALVVLA